MCPLCIKRVLHYHQINVFYPSGKSKLMMLVRKDCLVPQMFSVTCNGWTVYTTTLLESELYHAHIQFSREKADCTIVTLGGGGSDGSLYLNINKVSHLKTLKSLRVF